MCLVSTNIGILASTTIARFSSLFVSGSQMLKESKLALFLGVSKVALLTYPTLWSSFTSRSTSLRNPNSNHSWWYWKFTACKFSFVSLVLELSTKVQSRKRAEIVSSGPRYSMGTYWSRLFRGHLVIQTIQRVPGGPRYSKILINPKYPKDT